MVSKPYLYVFFLSLTTLFSASLSNSFAEKSLNKSIHHSEIPNLNLHENHHGLRELTPEDREKIRAIQKFKLQGEVLENPRSSKVNSSYRNINPYKYRPVSTGVYFSGLSSGRGANVSNIIQKR